MNDSIKLKPCPFCGGEAILMSRETNYFATRFFVICDNCHASSKWCKNKEEAAEAWNRRAEQTDTKPIKTGEWLEDEYAYFRCSKCGYEQDQPETVTPYCPGCGAHMEDESEVTED